MSLKRLSEMSVVLLLALCFLYLVSVPHPKRMNAQTLSNTPATIQAGSGSPASNSIPCAGVTTASTALYDDNSGSAGNTIWKCRPSGWQAPYNATSFQNQDFTLQPGLFATVTAKSNVYYEPNASTIVAVTTREEGSPVCTAAPVLVILDLGTSPSTVYASATVAYSQTLSTSNTVASNTGLSVVMPAGHYMGIGFSAGTCVTPPTISSVVTVQ